MNDELASLLDGPTKPVLWVGAGASVAAGYPTTRQLTDKLLGVLPDSARNGIDPDQEFTQLVDQIAKVGGGDTEVLEQLSKVFREVTDPNGRPPRVTPVHTAIARLAGAGAFRAVVTTNYDPLLEMAMFLEGVPHVLQTFERNRDVGRDELRLLKVHGSYDDWRGIVLSQRSYEEFNGRYKRLATQLDELLAGSVVFVGCSMHDPRLLDWLRDRGAKGSHSWRPIMTKSAWDGARAAHDVLQRDGIRPIEIDGHDALVPLWSKLADERAPRVRGRFDVRVVATESGSTVKIPGLDDHTAKSPLDDPGFVQSLETLRELDHRPMQTDEQGGFVGQEAAFVADLHRLAEHVGERITKALLSDDARRSLHAAILEASADPEPRHLHLVVESAGGADTLADDVLALPWELLRIDGKFPVSELRLDVSREALVENLEGLDAPTDELRVVATVAAPLDATQLDYETECWELWRALGGDADRLELTDAGTLDEMVAATKELEPAVLHFTGHGSPGVLLFENEAACGAPVGVGDFVTRLRTAWRLPRCVYLACCHGAEPGKIDPRRALAELTGATESVEAAGEATRDERGASDPRLVDQCVLERAAPSTAATLNRAGFHQVVGYFGPVGDRQSTRVSEKFYAELRSHGDALAAIRAARVRAREAHKDADGKSRIRYPLGWAQIALYQRGEETKTALPLRPGRPRIGTRHERRVAKLGPRVERVDFGFVGRRVARADAFARWGRGERAMVVCGLGGLGKTAVCTDLAPRLAARQLPEDLSIAERRQRTTQVVLDGREARLAQDPVQSLWEQVQRAVPEQDDSWNEVSARFAENGITGAAVVALIGEVAARAENLLLYLDDAESLQVDPSNAGGNGKSVGDWLDTELAEFWQRLLALAEPDGTVGVIASSRYVPDGTPSELCHLLAPMPKFDIVKMMSWFVALGRVPHDVADWLAERIDGHPRTVDFLDGLVQKREVDEYGQRGAYSGGDWQRQMLEPVLPEVDARIGANLLLPNLIAALSPEERTHAERCCALLGPVPFAALRSLEDEISNGATEELSRIGLLSRWAVAAKGKVESHYAMHGLVVGAVGDVEDGLLQSTRRRLSDWFDARFEASSLAADAAESANYALECGYGPVAYERARRVALWHRGAGRFLEGLKFFDRLVAMDLDAETRKNAVGLQVQFERISGVLHLRESPAERLRQTLTDVASEAEGFVLHELAGVLRAQGDLGSARELLERSQKIQQKLYGTDEHPEVAASLQQLAGVVQAQGDLGSARELLESSLKIEQKLYGTDEHPSVSASLHELAGVVQAQGDLGSARQLLERSQKIQQKLYGTDEHPDVATSLHQLAGVVQEQGDLGSARQLLERSLKIQQKLYGTDEHPSVSASLHQLAGVVQEQGDLGSARQLLERSLKLKQKLYGTDEHPSVAISQVNLGTLLLSSNPSESETLRGIELIVGAHNFFVRALGPDHPHTRQVGSIIAQLRGAAGESGTGESESTG